MMRGWSIALLAAQSLMVPACAERGSTMAVELATPVAEGPSADQPRRVVPITGYTLALIWAPQHCLAAVPGASALACGRADERRFLLHGLWPDGAAGQWPQWCAPARILPRRVIARHYRATPSAQLLQHEWAKHGTCIPGATPESYFARSGKLFARVRYPDMAALARAPLSEARFAEAFASANYGMKSSHIRLNLDRDGWLQEVWICLDRRLRYTSCATSLRAAREVRIR